MNTRSTQHAKTGPDLLTGPVGLTLLKFSIPFMLSTLLQTLYSTTDTIVVGQYLGSRGLSAVSNASMLMQMLYMLCVGFASAGQILIAQTVGADNREAVQKTIGNLFISEIILSIFTGLVCLVFAGSLIQLLGTPAEAAAQAALYVQICGAGMVFTGVYNMFSAILRGCGDSRHPLIFVLIASVINIVLDIVFIAWLHWDVAGAALATIIGQLFSVLFSFYFCIRHSRELGFSLRIQDIRTDRTAMSQLVRLGVPLALQTGAIQFSFLFVSRMINSIGLTFSAAFGVAQKLRSIPGILGQSLSLGCSSMIGQNWGARKNDRVSAIVRWGIFYCCCIQLAFGILFYAAPSFCFRLFTSDITVLELASMCMLAIVLERPGSALISPCGALVNAQGFASFSIIVALVDAFVGRVFLCWFFGIFLGMGAFGFLLGYIGGTYLTAIPTFVYYISGLWKKRPVLAEHI